MIYPLRFPRSFFYKVGEPSDGHPTLNDRGRPISVWSAVECMRLQEPTLWARMCGDVFKRDPEEVASDEVVGAIVRVNVTSNSSYPYYVWIDQMGDFGVYVYADDRGSMCTGLNRTRRTIRGAVEVIRTRVLDASMRALDAVAQTINKPRWRLVTDGSPTAEECSQGVLVCTPSACSPEICFYRQRVDTLKKARDDPRYERLWWQPLPAPPKSNLSAG